MKMFEFTRFFADKNENFLVPLEVSLTRITFDLFICFDAVSPTNVRIFSSYVSERENLSSEELNFYSIPSPTLSISESYMKLFANFFAPPATITSMSRSETTTTKI